MQGNKPNLFLVGPPRSGSTAIYHLLGQHPEVFMCPGKEPHYFTEGLVSWGPRRMDYPKDEAEYLALFRGAAGKKFVGEASACYLTFEGAAGRIKEFSPDAKILIILRDPSERLRSIFYSVNFVYRYARGMSYREFEKQQFLKGGKSNPHLLYAGHIKRYYSLFGKNVLVLGYSDFRKDNLKVAQEIYRFLGIDHAFKPELKETNVSGEPRGVAGHVYRFICKSGIHPFASRHFLRKEGVLRDACLFFGRPLKKKAFTKESREKLPVDTELLGSLYADWDEAVAFCREKGILLAAK